MGSEKNQGAAEALEGEGQPPSNKAGFGFRPEMASAGVGCGVGGGRFGLQKRCVMSGEEKRAKKRKYVDGVEEDDQYVLPTKYDKWEELNERDNVLRSAVPQSNKQYFWNK